MNAFELDDLLNQQRQIGEAYLEFLRAASLSVGIYTLQVGAPDLQQPHGEDEVYYVVRGRGQIQVNGQDHAVAPGSIVFVARGVGHRFHNITEDLITLVFFAPAEGTDEASDYEA